MIKIIAGIVAVLASQQTVAATSPYQLKCRLAGGFYAWLDASESAGILHVNANQGYADELNEKLGLSPRFLGQLTMDLPMTGCRTLADDLLPLTCQNEQVQLHFSGDEAVDVVADRIDLRVSRVATTTTDGTTTATHARIYLQIPALANSADQTPLTAEVDVAFERPMGECEATTP